MQKIVPLSPSWFPRVSRICKEKLRYNVVSLSVSWEQRRSHTCLVFRAQFLLAPKTEQTKRLKMFLKVLILKAEKNKMKRETQIYFLGSANKNVYGMYI